MAGDRRHGAHRRRWRMDPSDQRVRPTPALERRLSVADSLAAREAALRGPSPCVLPPKQGPRSVSTLRLKVRLWDRTDADPTPRETSTGCALTLICRVVAAAAVLEPAR